ncbi:NYN domain-containing protein [Bradyrhizobium liaoningense]
MKTAILIDGGYLRACAKRAGHQYDPAFIEAFSKRCTAPPEYLLRVLYYDSPQFRGKVQLPVSGASTNFQASDKWLEDLAKLERFAVRRGTIAFRGWVPKNIPLPGGAPLTDQDFTPTFEQKGVDMRIGLDIAIMSDRRVADRLILVSGDTDMIPVMKHARRAGIEIILAQLPAPTRPLHDTLKAHSDSVRNTPWS